MGIPSLLHTHVDATPGCPRRNDDHEPTIDSPRIRVSPEVGHGVGPSSRRSRFRRIRVDFATGLVPTYSGSPEPLGLRFRRSAHLVGVGA